MNDIKGDWWKKKPCILKGKLLEGLPESTNHHGPVKIATAFSPNLMVSLFSSEGSMNPSCAHISFPNQQGLSQTKTVCQNDILFLIHLHTTRTKPRPTKEGHGHEETQGSDDKEQYCACDSQNRSSGILPKLDGVPLLVGGLLEPVLRPHFISKSTRLVPNQNCLAEWHLFLVHLHTTRTKPRPTEEGHGHEQAQGSDYKEHNSTCHSQNRCGVLPKLDGVPHLVRGLFKPVLRPQEGQHYLVRHVLDDVPRGINVASNNHVQLEPGRQFNRNNFSLNSLKKMAYMFGYRKSWEQLLNVNSIIKKESEAIFKPKHKSIFFFWIRSLGLMAMGKPNFWCTSTKNSCFSFMGCIPSTASRKLWGPIQLEKILRNSKLKKRGISSTDFSSSCSLDFYGAFWH